MKLSVHEIGIVLVGDQESGKTNFVLTCSNKPPTLYHTPTILDLSETLIRLNQGNMAQISFWDTGGSAHNDRLRPIAYNKAKIFIVVFDCTNPVSLENACAKWLNQLRESPNREVVFVGSHKDKRTSDRCNLQQQCLPEYLIRQKLRMYGFDYYECECRCGQETKRCLRMILERLLEKHKGREYWQIITY